MYVVAILACREKCKYVCCSFAKPLEQENVSLNGKIAYHLIKERKKYFLFLLKLGLLELYV